MRYYMHWKNEVVGPLEPGDIRKRAPLRDLQVCEEGSESWYPASVFPEFQRMSKDRRALLFLTLPGLIALVGFWIYSGVIDPVRAPAEKPRNAAFDRGHADGKKLGAELAEHATGVPSGDAMRKLAETRSNNPGIPESEREAWENGFRLGYRKGFEEVKPPGSRVNHFPVGYEYGVVAGRAYAGTRSPVPTEVDLHAFAGKQGAASGLTGDDRATWERGFMKGFEAGYKAVAKKAW